MPATPVDPIMAANQANAAYWASQAQGDDGAAKNAAHWAGQQPGQATSSVLSAGGGAEVPPWLAQENDRYGTLGGPTVARDVKQLANQLGVRLATVRGSGTGGAPTRSDVELAASAQRRTRPVSTAAAPAAPAYTRPPFTASGIDPSNLSSVPESVRPAMAAATTPAEAFRIRERYGSMSDVEACAQLRTDPAVKPEHGGQLSWPGR